MLGPLAVELARVRNARDVLVFVLIQERSKFPGILESGIFRPLHVQKLLPLVAGVLVDRVLANRVFVEAWEAVVGRVQGVLHQEGEDWQQFNEVQETEEQPELSYFVVHRELVIVCATFVRHVEVPREKPVEHEAEGQLGQDRDGE